VTVHHDLIPALSNHVVSSTIGSAPRAARLRVRAKAERYWREEKFGLYYCGGQGYGDN